MEPPRLAVLVGREIRITRYAIWAGVRLLSRGAGAGADDGLARLAVGRRLTIFVDHAPLTGDEGTRIGPRVVAGRLGALLHGLAAPTAAFFHSQSVTGHKYLHLMSDCMRSFEMNEGTLRSHATTGKWVAARRKTVRGALI